MPGRGLEWHTTIDVDHPLVGRIWDGRSGTFVDRATLEAELAKARFVLLGEKHDNEDHHRLQASLLEALTTQGRRPAVVMEMIDVDQNDLLAAQRAKTPHDSDALAKAVRWEERHWPSFAFYRPIVQHALDTNLVLLGGNYPSASIKKLFAPDTILDSEHVDDFPESLPTSLRESLERDLAQSHCGAMPTTMIPAMVIAQRMRDESMALALATHEKPDGAVLIAGEGHVRKDRGVPWALAQRTKASIVSVAMIEVANDQTRPGDYVAGGAAQFDFVWFTPRANDVDPCAAMTKAAPPKAP